MKKLNIVLQYFKIKVEYVRIFTNGTQKNKLNYKNEV
jgi:hypothetical protein